MCSRRSSFSTTITTRSPETRPTAAAPRASNASHPAVTATRPAREAFRHMETSGLPFLIQVKISVVQVATDGAMVVVRKMDDSSDTEVAAAPLNPYQPSHRMNTPSAPRGMEWPGIALTFVTLPSLSFTYLPMRGPRTAAPISAAMPPTMWMAQDPA